MARHRLFAGFEPRFDGEELGGVGLDAAGLAAVVEPGRLHRCEMRGLQRRPRSGQRVLDSLVRPDRPPEHDTLARISRGPPNGVAADPDGFGGDQDALGVEALEDVAEPLALFADAIGLRDAHAVEIDLVRVDGLSPHLLDLPDPGRLAVEIREEEAQPLGRRVVAARGRAGEQHDLLRDLGGRGPDFLTVDDIIRAVPLGPGGDPGGVEPGIGFGDREAHLAAPLDQRRQPAAFLSLAAMGDDRAGAEDVHMHARGRRHRPARGGDGRHRQRRLRHAETGPAIRFRHRDPEPAAGGDRIVEGVRELPVAVALQPIGVVEGFDRSADAFDDRVLVVVKPEIHRPSRPVAVAAIVQGGRRSGKGRGQSRVSPGPKCCASRKSTSPCRARDRS